jgi:hypothetical protein
VLESELDTSGSAALLESEVDTVGSAEEECNKGDDAAEGCRVIGAGAGICKGGIKGAGEAAGGSVVDEVVVKGN